MPNEYDPYREALVMEESTIWPEEFDALSAGERQQIAARLHATPQEAAELEYVRTHTGFCRKITATVADVERARLART